MRTIDFPDSWSTGTPIKHHVMSNPEKTVTIATVLLDDGSGLWSLIFKGGHRFARTAACTGWAIEEQFHGDPLPDEAAEVTEMWRTVIRLMVDAGHKADEMLGVRHGR